MIRRPPRSTLSSSSAASDVYKRQGEVERIEEEDHPRAGVVAQLDVDELVVEDALEGELRGLLTYLDHVAPVISGGRVTLRPPGLVRASVTAAKRRQEPLSTCPAAATSTRR